MTHPASSSASSSSLSSHQSSHHVPAAFPTPGAIAPAAFTSASVQATSPSHSSTSAADNLSAPQQTTSQPSAAAVPLSASSSTAPSTSATTVSRASAEPTHAGTPKVLPYSFDDALIDDVLVLVVDMLVKLTEHNDSLPLHPSALTRFHSRATPNISLSAYLRRIAKYTAIEKCCVLILLVYIDRVCERLEGFTICGLTVHRFICAAILCASKALCDAFNTNEHYAKVGGISLQEINLLEKEFLQIIDWRLICSGAMLQHYYASLVRNHKDYVLAEPKPGQHEAQVPTEMEVDTVDGGGLSANGHSSSSGTSGNSPGQVSSSSRDPHGNTRPTGDVNEAVRPHHGLLQTSALARGQAPAMGNSQHSSPFPLSSNDASPHTPMTAVNGIGGLVAGISSASTSASGGSGRAESSFTSPSSAMQVDTDSVTAAAPATTALPVNSRRRKDEHRTPPSPPTHSGPRPIDSSSSSSLVLGGAQSNGYPATSGSPAQHRVHQPGNAADTSKRSRLDHPPPP